jgi:hypothetical protein
MPTTERRANAKALNGACAYEPELLEFVNAGRALVWISQPYGRGGTGVPVSLDMKGDALRSVRVFIGDTTRTVHARQMPRNLCRDLRDQYRRHFETLARDGTPGVTPLCVDPERLTRVTPDRVAEFMAVREAFDRVLERWRSSGRAALLTRCPCGTWFFPRTHRNQTHCPKHARSRTR